MTSLVNLDRAFCSHFDFLRRPINVSHILLSKTTSTQGSLLPGYTRLLQRQTSHIVSSYAVYSFKGRSYNPLHVSNVGQPTLYKQESQITSGLLLLWGRNVPILLQSFFRTSWKLVASYLNNFRILCLYISSFEHLDRDRFTYSQT